MAETAERITSTENKEKSNIAANQEKAPQNFNERIHELYDELGRQSPGKILSPASAETFKHIPQGGVSADGSIDFSADRSNENKVKLLRDIEGGLDFRRRDGGEQNGNVTKDAQGHVTDVTYPNGSSRHFGYDENGELNRIVQPDGKVVVKEGDKWKYEKQTGEKTGAGAAGEAAGAAAGGQAANSDRKPHGEQAAEDSNKQQTDKSKFGIGIGIFGGPDIQNPQVAADGTFTYSTKDGSQRTYKADGTSSIGKDGATTNFDENGRTTDINYANGQIRKFGYDADGQLNKVTDTNGQTYKLENGRWMGDDGKPAPINSIQLEKDGSFTYQNQDGQTITQHLDRTSQITNPNKTHLDVDADGRITKVDSGHGKHREFTYGEDGKINSITEADGTVVKPDEKGNWPDGRTNLQLEKDGTLNYTNKDGKVVIQENDGSVKVSDLTEKELHDQAEKLHTAMELSRIPLVGGMFGDSVVNGLKDMSPTDRVLLAKQYEQQYGKKLDDEISHLPGDDAARAGKLLYTAELQEYAVRNIPNEPGSDGKNQRQAFLDNMNDFLTRAKNDHIPDKDVAETFQQMLRLGEAPNSQVTGVERTWLVQQIAHNAAHPDQINQGYHGTCNVSDVEMIAFTRKPGDAAKVVADMALNGEYIAPDGKKISIPPQNFVPESEARTNPPADGQRSFADQLFQVAMVNDEVQRETPPKYYTTLPASGGTDEGDYWTDKDGKPLLTEKKNDKGEVEKDESGNPIMVPWRMDGLGVDAITRQARQFDGQSVIENGHDFKSEKDLQHKIEDAQKDGKMPLIITVAGGDPLFGGDKPVGDPKHDINHVVVIRDYNPDTGMVKVDNSWGSDADKWVPIGDLYNASKGS